MLGSYFVGPGALLHAHLPDAQPGLLPHRSLCVQGLGEQTPAFRAAIQLVVIDPSAPYASGIRAALPDVRIAVSYWVVLDTTIGHERASHECLRATLGRR